MIHERIVKLIESFVPQITEEILKDNYTVLERDYRTVEIIVLDTEMTIWVNEGDALPTLFTLVLGTDLLYPRIYLPIEVKTKLLSISAAEQTQINQKLDQDIAELQSRKG